MKDKKDKNEHKKSIFLDSRKIGLILAIVIIIGAILFIEVGKKTNFGSSPALDDLKSGKAESPTDDYIATQKNSIHDANELQSFNNRIAAKEKKYPKAIELLTDGYINTKDDDAIRIKDLIGKKIIVIDFWTYSCINCQRTLPYMNAWYDRYKDKGLEIIGVHSPEFDFEKNKANVELAVKKFNISFPVAQDNNHLTFAAYQNRYWPRKYIIDIDGFIVYNHIGEGGYDETEQEIKKLLKEREQIYGMDENLPEGLANPQAIDTNQMQVGSQETYFGSARNTNLGNGVMGISGIQEFKEASNKKLNYFYLKGKWNIYEEYAECLNNCELSFNYLSKDVYMVAGSKDTTTATIFIDGKSDSDLAGADTTKGIVKINDYTLYRIAQGKTYSAHSLEIKEISEGTQFFTFTFG